MVFKEKMKELKKLKTLGDMCFVTTKSNIQGKLNDSGSVCIFVGNSQSNSNDAY
jgi:hypothetical protein